MGVVHMHVEDEVSDDDEAPPPKKTVPSTCKSKAEAKRASTTKGARIQSGGARVGAGGRSMALAESPGVLRSSPFGRDPILPCLWFLVPFFLLSHSCSCSCLLMRLRCSTSLPHRPPTLPPHCAPKNARSDRARRDGCIH
jgi:hypothetical protein